jgi:hypothetical protein
MPSRAGRAPSPDRYRFLRLGVALLVRFDSVNPGRLDGLSMMHAVLVWTDEFLRKIWFHLRGPRLCPESQIAKRARYARGWAFTVRQCDLGVASNLRGCAKIVS